MWRAGRRVLLQGRKYLDKVSFSDFCRKKNICLRKSKQGKANVKKVLPATGGHSFHFWKKVTKSRIHKI